MQKQKLKERADQEAFNKAYDEKQRKLREKEKAAEDRKAKRAEDREKTLQVRCDVLCCVVWVWCECGVGVVSLNLAC